MMAPKAPHFASVEQLEAELRAYLGGLPADELSDDSRPPPLAYSELSRNGRDDLARASMEFGGYIQLSNRLGVRWRLPPKEVRVPLQEVNNFDASKATRTGFLKLGNALRATEDVLETKKLSDFERSESKSTELVRQQQVARSKLASLIQPTQKPYVNEEDKLPGRQLLVDLQMSLPQRASTVLFVWALGLAFGPHPALPLDAETALVVRTIALGWGGLHSALGIYAAVVASRQQRSAPVWLFKTALAGFPSLAEVVGESTRLLPGSTVGEKAAAKS
ncbi:hypothetical protein T492DRAFT_930375 [Pavlovales sp. CCMP2436]|nr:hypothetical protein T492DRAFT_930375 [Pavlovales sp. CCMP2436]